VLKSTMDKGNSGARFEAFLLMQGTISTIYLVLSESILREDDITTYG
jgi:hypothetical protein